jgi:tRNA-Thr(GGU) m(6)t(6)A37 methyltransferase TsaA
VPQVRSHLLLWFTEPVQVPCPLPVIGVVHSDRSSAETTPVQAGLNRAEYATLEIFEPFAEGMAGLDGFDYAWLLAWLHKPDRPTEGAPPLTQVPFLLRNHVEQRRMGVFATRGPRRVNPIGLSLVQLCDLDGRFVKFAGVDLLDGTPVLDVKPYVTRFDRPDGDPRCGWFDQVPLPEGVTPSDLGPTLDR